MEHEINGAVRGKVPEMEPPSKEQYYAPEPARAGCCKDLVGPGRCIIDNVLPTQW